MGSQNEPAKQLLRKPVLKTRALATSHQPVVAMGWIHTTTCVRRYANISGFWRKARFAHSRRDEGREAPCSGRRAAVEWHLDEGSTLKDPYKTQILVQPHTVSPLSIHQGILKALAGVVACVLPVCLTSLDPSGDTESARAAAGSVLCRRVSPLSIHQGILKGLDAQRRQRHLAQSHLSRSIRGY